VVPAPQAIVACAVPGSVLGPISQVHVTSPLALARAAPKPRDSLRYPLGKVTSRSQESFGLGEWALSESSAPGLTVVSIDVTVTEDPPSEPVGGGEVLGAVTVVPAA
jgi:hypothetical protein